MKNKVCKIGKKVLSDLTAGSLLDVHGTATDLLRSIVFDNYLGDPWCRIEGGFYADLFKYNICVYVILTFRHQSF
jgi:hypothetical protein